MKTMGTLFGVISQRMGRCPPGSDPAFPWIGGLETQPERRLRGTAMNQVRRDRGTLKATLLYTTIVLYLWWLGLHDNILQGIRITGLMEDRKHVSLLDIFLLFDNIIWRCLAEF